MPEVFLMPALSPTMTQGHIVKWHKNLGDKIQSGDALLDIETDKAIMEVEATRNGVLHHIFIPAPCQSVNVGHPIALIRQADENPDDIDLSDYASQTSPAPIQEEPYGKQQPPMSAQNEPSRFEEPSSQKDQVVYQEPVPVSRAMDKESGENQRIKVSPLARKMAQEHKLNLREVQATGPGGRIVQKDILEALACIEENKKLGLENKGRAFVPVTGMRKVIAQRLTFSKQTIPHFYLSMDFSMDALLALRAQLNEKAKRFSVNDLLMRACALALRDKPVMGHQWHDDGILTYASVDLAVAVSIEGGLITPIVRQADTKSLTQLAQEFKDLVMRARSGKLKPDEYQGGSFTLSNLGMFGIHHFQAIINPPHSAILAVGATRAAPVVRDGRIEPGQILSASLAVDHRVLDGQDASEFMGLLRDYVEAPYSLMM